MLIPAVSSLFAGLGESGVPALLMDSYGARAISLGDAYSGLADDINAISVNPAGLNTLDSFQAGLMYMPYPLDMNFGSAVIGTRLPAGLYGGYLAFSMDLFILPDFDQYDESGSSVEGKLSAGDTVFNLAYANNPLRILGLRENLNFGINFKYIHTRLVDISRNALAFDLGLLYRMSISSLGRKKLLDNLGLGVSVQNLGSSLKFVSEETLLPRNIRAGASYKFLGEKEHEVLTALELNLPNDSSVVFNCGLEYSFRQRVFVRLGYKFTEERVDNLSLGLGGRYTVSRLNIGFDYSFIPSEDIGARHVISLVFRHIPEQKSSGTEPVMEIKDQKKELRINISDEQTKLFDKESVELRKEALPVLDKVADVIKDEDYRRVVIMVHTDDAGDREHRTYMSDNRAKAIYDYLVEKGIDSKRTTFKGYGAEKQVADNSTEQGRSRNRRSEILIIRWKEGEEKEFKQYYFFGLDAFIKESYADAISNWNKALKMDPENEELQKRIKEAEKKLQEKKSSK